MYRGSGLAVYRWRSPGSLVTLTHMSDKPIKVFVSHSSQDKPLVIPMAEALRKLGIDAWVDKDRKSVV